MRNIDKKYNFSTYDERNFNKKGKSDVYNTLSEYYGNMNNSENTVTPTAIIYQKESRVCPKKGNKFYFKGVS
jgi:hypothetical protein